MKKGTIYEWQLLELDEDNEIDNIDFSEFLSWDIEPNQTLRLVKMIGSDSAGITEYLIANVVDGELPEYFEDSDVKVPSRYKKELSQWLAI